jgi:hypothetical protein
LIRLLQWSRRDRAIDYRVHAEVIGAIPLRLLDPDSLEREVRCLTCYQRFAAHHR